MLANAAGCDSIVTLNLTINSPSAGTDIQSACASYTWMDGITYTASNNSATYTLVDVNGCDSVVTLDLTILPLPLTTVSNNSPVLTADATGASYQWIDCDNGNAPINGATSQVFTATTNGNYAALITQNGCSDTSACITVANVGLSDLSHENGFSVYPNPVSSELIVYAGDILFTKLEMCTLDGKVLRSLIVESKQFILDVSDLNPGVYFLKVEGSTGFKRFVKI
ncbi:MAG: hypothetical protein A3D92_08415 [Bacteroidetes bacterium RIFCSPHIGHO2_02_FULL_44_7]|nr:MAG: hypothetical protein A3D92_08415 [Bacteroidetes bacterium RIFCSPHIGHO2_02_FULL_44_7]